MTRWSLPSPPIYSIFLEVLQYFCLNRSIEIIFHFFKYKWTWFSHKTASTFNSIKNHALFNKRFLTFVLFNVITRSNLYFD